MLLVVEIAANIMRLSTFNTTIINTILTNSHVEFDDKLGIQEHLCLGKLLDLQGGGVIWGTDDLEAVGLALVVDI